MPKIIYNLQSRLIGEARRQIEESGYSSMTIRSVASACGVGVGTVYNYFPSKEALVATYLLEDWKTCLTAIEAVSRYSDCPEPTMRCICDQLRLFVQRHSAVFMDEAAMSGFAGSFGRYHAMLRSQLALPLQKFTEDTFTAEFLAESLLTWTSEGKEFEQIYAILLTLF